MKMFMEAEAHINRSTRKQKETRKREIVDSFFFFTLLAFDFRLSESTS